MKSFLSVLGLYNFDNSIFDDIILPAGIEKETVIYRILLECAELEIIYPIPSILKDTIGIWSRTRSKAWERMVIALSETYNPLHNYSMEENIFEVNDNENESNTTGNGSTYKQGFNVDSLVNTNEVDSKSKTNLTGRNTRDYDRSVKGNALGGSFQNNINKELNLRKKDIYKIIVEEFKKEFCVLVY